jgi:hypothetical protein
MRFYPELAVQLERKGTRSRNHDILVSSRTEGHAFTRAVNAHPPLLFFFLDRAAIQKE